MLYTVEIDEEGRVTLPPEVREACGIVPGSRLQLSNVRDRQFECYILPPRMSLVELTREYQMDGPAPDMKQLREEFEEAAADDFIRRMRENQAWVLRFCRAHGMVPAAQAAADVTEQEG